MHWRRKWQPTPVFLPENPRDGGAWWAAIYGVAQSRTRLKRLSSSSSSIYSFLLVRYSCPLSAGVRLALLCLMVYSWCISGERCTQRPPTPPPSCSLYWKIFDHSLNFIACDWCVYVFYFFLVQSWSVLSYKFVQFFQVVHFIGVYMLVVVSYDPLYFCDVSCNFSFFHFLFCF